MHILASFLERKKAIFFVASTHPVAPCILRGFQNSKKIVLWNTLVLMENWPNKWQYSKMGLKPIQKWKMLETKGNSTMDFAWSYLLNWKMIFLLYLWSNKRSFSCWHQDKSGSSRPRPQCTYRCCAHCGYHHSHKQTNSWRCCCNLITPHDPLSPILGDLFSTNICFRNCFPSAFAFCWVITLSKTIWST